MHIAETKRDSMELQIQEAYNSKADFDNVFINIQGQEPVIHMDGSRYYKVYYTMKYDGYHHWSPNVIKPSDAAIIQGLNILSPRGILYEFIVDDNIVPYVHAFTFDMSMAIKYQDLSSVKTELEEQWKEFLGEPVDVILYMRQDDHLLTSENGLHDVSIFRVPYSVSVPSTHKLRPGAFAVDLPHDKTLEALQNVPVSGYSGKFYGDFLMSKRETENTVDYSFVSAMCLDEQHVTEADWQPVRDELQTRWRTVSSDYSETVIRLVSQEDHIDLITKSIVNCVMYEVIVRGIPQGPDDLPDPPNVEVTLSSTMAALPSDSINNRIPLRQALTVNLCQRLAIEEQETFVDAIREIGNPDDFTSVYMGAQDSVISEDGTETVNIYSVAYQDSHIVDARFLTPVDISALNTQLAADMLDSACPIQTVTGSRSLRQSHCIQVKGTVAKSDYDIFTVPIETAWESMYADTSVTFAKSEEYLTNDGERATGLCYFVTLDNFGGSVLVPGSLAEPTQDTLVTGVTVVSSVTSESYQLYFDETTRYDDFYSISVVGDLTFTEMDTLVDVMQNYWQEHFDSRTVEVSRVQNLERNYGSYGVGLTKILYKLRVDSKSVLPVHIPSPSASKLLTLVDSEKYTLYTDATVTRAETAFCVKTLGAFSNDHIPLMETALLGAWADHNPTEISVFGRKQLTSSDGMNMVNEVCYTLTSDEGIIFVSDVAPPAEDSMRQALDDQSLQLYIEDTLEIRNILLYGRIPATDVPVTAIKQAWSTAAAATAVVNVLGTERYMTPTWTEATLVYYTVSVSGQNPESVPSRESINAAIISVPNYSTEVCYGSAMQAYQLYLSGDSSVLLTKVADIRDAIENAWKQANQLTVLTDSSVVAAMDCTGANSCPGVSTRHVVQALVEVVQTSSRRRRSASNDTFTAGDGSSLSAVNYMILVDGVAPDELFVSPPLDALLDNLLASNGVPTCGCTPRRCSSMYVAGSLTDDATLDIQTALLDAYRAANPGLTDNLQVSISQIDGTLSDVNGNSLSQVGFCVWTSGDNLLGDVIDPSTDELEQELLENGHTLNPTPGTVNSSVMGNSTVIIIVCICGAVALIFVLMALIKVAYRQYRIERERVLQSNHDRRHINDEETFAGHAMYGGSVYSKDSMGKPYAF